MICEFLGLLLISLNADEKYSLRISENLPQTYKMQLSQKQKKNSAAFLKICEKNDDPQNEITHCKRHGLTKV